MNFLDRLSMRSKLLFLTLFPLWLTMSLLNSIRWYDQYHEMNAEYELIKETQMAERRAQLKSYIIMAKSAIQHLYENTASDLDQSRLQEKAKVILRELRYAKDGYFYVVNAQGINVAHGVNPAIEGRNMLPYQDEAGNFVVKDMFKAVQPGGDGFSHFVWRKPSNGTIAPKLGYAEMVPNWNWVIGTGYYIDDIETYLTKVKQERNDQWISDIVWQLMVSAILLIFIGIAIIWASRRIVRPLENMVETLEGIACGQGDLTQRLDVQTQDEVGRLGNAFNRFMSSLQQLIKDVSQAADAVYQSSSNIQSQVEENHQKVQEHCGQTDQVVTAVTEMNHTAQDVADNTENAAQATHDADEQSKQARHVAETAVERINALVAEVSSASEVITQLHQETDQIAQVLAVIGEIADQTNLLALNAAIEAARAGEQGRGFAVVADEVRNLAGRTQQSTEEINQMLGRLQSGVKNAVDAMTQSHERSQQTIDETSNIINSLQSVGSSVSTINDMNAQIASAAKQQYSVSDDISHNLIVIQGLVDELGRYAEGIQTDGHEMLAAGEQLRSLVSKFRV